MYAVKRWFPPLVCLILCWISQSALPHPTQFHTAAHEAAIFLDIDQVLLEYTVKLPARTSAEAEVIVGELQQQDWTAGWLIEVNGRALSWETSKPMSISAKSQSIEVFMELKASLPNAMERLRLSNSNLLDTHALFANTLWISASSPLVLLETKPPLSNDSAQLANFRGVWTMKPASRELSLAFGEPASGLERIHRWVTQRSPWVQPTSVTSESPWTSWTQGQTHRTLSILLTGMVLLIACLGATNLRENHSSRWSEVLISTFILCGSLLWWPPNARMPLFGLILLCAALLLCAPHAQRFRFVLYPLIIIGLCWLYGAPRLIPAGLASHIGLTLAKPKVNLSTKGRLHQLTTTLIISVVVFGLLRVR